MRAWTVVFQDNRIERMESLGRRLADRPRLYAAYPYGRLETDYYDYTGLCPRQKVAFVRLSETVSELLKAPVDHIEGY